MELIHKTVRLYRGGMHLLAQAAPLLTRLVLGHAFIETGLGKWRNFEGTVAFFTDLHIPFPAANAAFIATLELVGGAALILGLGTRIFSLLLASTMIVALGTADHAALLEALGGGEATLLGIVPFVYLMSLLLLAGQGPGAIALDRFAARALERPFFLRWTASSPALSAAAGRDS